MPIQDSLIPQYVPSEVVENIPQKEKEQTTGSRINPSQIEILSQLYDKYSNSEEEIDIENLFKQKEKTEILENAKWSIYGTQMHSLQYFTLLFARSAYYNRVPTYEDFRNTFLQRKPEYYSSFLKILQLTEEYTSTEVLDSSQNFWNEWRMNGQDFTPGKHKNYTLSPTQIRSMWEDGVVQIKDIDRFREGFKDVESDKLNPEKTFLANETFLILNLYFNNSNLLIPTLIDEICIPKDFPKKPIEIVDYKTGKQFKKPEYKEKIQIYLMLCSVLTNIIDRVNDIQYAPSQWEIAHENLNIQFPQLIGKKGNKKFVSSIYSHHTYELFQTYKESILFSYVNPLTQEKIDIDFKNIGLDSKAGFNDINMYLSNISDFYLKNKKILKYSLDSSRSPYTLPSFPLKDFEKSNGFSKGIQLPVF